MLCKKMVVFLMAGVLGLFASVSEADPLRIVTAHNQTSQENPYQYGMLKFKEVMEGVHLFSVVWYKPHLLGRHTSVKLLSVYLL